MRPATLERLDESALGERARSLKDAGGRMEVAYAWRTGSDDDVELRYVVAAAGSGDFRCWAVTPSVAPPSLTPIWPLLAWPEREVADGFGLRFQGHPDPQPLLLDFGQDAGLPEVSEPGAQVLPFGPIRADVFESAAFSFLYVGEHILHYRPHLFLKRRGMEARFEGANPGQAVVLAERVSGVGSVAHAIAYCTAVEHAAECVVPRRAEVVRTLAAELERVYNHLHYLGHLCSMTTLKVGDAEGTLLEERAKQLASRFCGHRLLHNLLVPGGLRREVVVPDGFEASLAHIEADFERFVRLMAGSDSHVDRLVTTGLLPREVAFDHGATGPVVRASGLDRDLRRDHPYAAYRDYAPDVAGRGEGDAAARAAVRIDETRASFELLRRLAGAMGDGPVRVACQPPPGAEGLGWAESPRGSLFYAVHVGPDGRLARVKIRSPSFSNWRVFAYTVHDSNMMDYAINEASFGLTIAGVAG